jgi:hypothetical protein
MLASAVGLSAARPIAAMASHWWLISYHIQLIEINGEHRSPQRGAENTNEYQGLGTPAGSIASADIISFSLFPTMQQKESIAVVFEDYIWKTSILFSPLS